MCAAIERPGRSLFINRLLTGRLRGEASCCAGRTLNIRLRRALLGGPLLSPDTKCMSVQKNIFV